MLIDGNSLTYRAFFALPTDMATASGQVTNAVFGFTSMLINLLRDHQPDGVVVTFDLPGPTFRHKLVPTYKAGREAAPDILRQQMGLVRQVVEALKMPIVDMENYEADDIIATFATELRDRADDVIIVTGDRDSYQLVEDPHIKVLYNMRGVSDYALYDEAGIKERTGVSPADYVAYASMRGDKSDNLPGVPGVGEKTAAKLINTYGGIDGIYEHLDEQTPKLRENLAANEDNVRSNLEMMRLLRDLDHGQDLDELVMGDVDIEEVRTLFEFLEFRSLFDRLNEVLDGRLGEDAGTAEVLEAELYEVESSSEAVSLLAKLNQDTTPLAMAEGQDDASGGLAIVTDGAGCEVSWLRADIVSDPEVVDSLRTLTGAEGRPLATHDGKTLTHTFLDLGIDPRSLSLDTMLAGYLLDPAEARYLLADLLRRYADFEFPSDDEEAIAEGQLDFDNLDVDATSPAQEAARRALAVDRLMRPMAAALDSQGLTELNETIEVPLVRVLAKMENLGIGVDRAELQALRDQLAADTDRLRQAVVDDAGEDFNVNSTKQMREILFEKLELTPQKKTKTGYSTDAASLEKLKGQHPIIEHLLEYREVEKLRSTYGEGLLAAVDADGRIRATFNQTVARTGRLSSDAPNLHNIPVRTEAGKSFRKAFVPAEGFEFLIADYNQIELRCIAHLAEDPGLIASFEAGDDIHSATAARIFGVDANEVTTEQRSKSKMVSYGLAYGMEAYGLGQRLAIPTSEASEILDAYFEAFPAVSSYMEQTVKQARQRGYTETLFGRRRQIPELASSNFRIRQAGERQAMNAGIQGLAADIFKVALVRLDEQLEQRGLKSRIILQVHDEVVVEVPPAEHDAVEQLTTDVMAQAFDLRVPLEVNLTFAQTWADAK